MKYYKAVVDGYVMGISTNNGQTEITETEYNAIMNLVLSAPIAPDGYTYKLRADNLEWELVKLSPVEAELLTDDEALTRYINEQTGTNDPDLVSAVETLIIHNTVDGIGDTDANNLIRGDY